MSDNKKIQNFDSVNKRYYEYKRIINDKKNNVPVRSSDVKRLTIHNKTHQKKIARGMATCFILGCIGGGALFSTATKAYEKINILHTSSQIKQEIIKEIEDDIGLSPSGERVYIREGWIDDIDSFEDEAKKRAYIHTLDEYIDNDVHGNLSPANTMEVVIRDIDHKKYASLDDYAKELGYEDIDDYRKNEGKLIIGKQAEIQLANGKEEKYKQELNSILEYNNDDQTYNDDRQK